MTLTPQYPVVLPPDIAERAMHLIGESDAGVHVRSGNREQMGERNGRSALEVPDPAAEILANDACEDGQVLRVGVGLAEHKAEAITEILYPGADVVLFHPSFSEGDRQSF